MTQNMQRLYSAAAIESRTRDIASQINKVYADVKTPIHVIVTMNGAFMFAADIVRQLTCDVVLHFMGGSFFTQGIKHEVGMNEDVLPTDFKGAPVLVVEDILDNGGSYNYILEHLKTRKTGPIRLVTLLKRQDAELTADFYGFTISTDAYVVGYGLDLDGHYRHLPELFTLTTLSAGGHFGGIVGSC